MKDSKEMKTLKGPISTELVSQARAGDQAAFSALYEQTHLALYRSVRSMVRDEDLAWDILQDSYLRAWQGLDKLEADEAFLPWLRRIAVNETARQAAKRLPVNFTDLSAAGDGEEEDRDPVIPDLRIDSQPELALDRKETSRLVREILAGLPEQQQLIVGMHYYEDMPIKEIAELLNLAPGTVKAQLFKGRRHVETKVRALERQGVKLYGMGPVPFLVALLRRLEPTRQAEKKAAAAVLAQAAAEGSQITALTAGQAFLHGLGAKLAAGLLTVALLAGGIWVGYRLLQDRRVPLNTEPFSTEASVVPSRLVEPVTEDPTMPTETIPSESKEQTEPVIIGSPEDPELDTAVRALFEDPNNWYCRALTSEYADPFQVDLGQLFYCGFPGADNRLSDEELEALSNKVDNLEEKLKLNCARFQTGETNDVLSHLYGLDLFTIETAQNRNSPFGDDFYEVWSSEKYYTVHFYEDTNIRPIEIRDIIQTDSGLVCVNYYDADGTTETDSELKTAVLLPRDGQYYILMNLKASDASSRVSDPNILLKRDIQILFATQFDWYSQALHSSFADPSTMNLSELFYNGIDGFASDEEAEALAALWPDSDEWPGSWYRIPTEQAAKILSQYFGLDPDQSAERLSEYFLSYLPEFDCYYTRPSDTNITPRYILDVRQQEDGTILFTYNNDFWYGLFEDSTSTVALRPDGSGNYQIISNLLGAWITKEDLGPLIALYYGTGPMQTETVDADGVKTIRELTLVGDGHLLYQEQKSGSDGIYYARGEWLLGDGTTLYCSIYPAEENGNAIDSGEYTSFACTYDGEQLTLIQQHKYGLGEDDKSGTELRFPLPAE